MGNSEFWSIWSALSTTFGAIATLCAVIVALWQSRLQYKKRLEVVLRQVQFFSTEDEYLSITVRNRGNREVTLNRFSWKYKDGSTLYILPQDYKFIANGISISFPYKLLPETSVDILCSIEFLRKSLFDAIKDNKISIKDNLCIFVVDSLGDYYYSKTKMNVNEIIKDVIGIESLPNES